ncbi:MAG: hypothetical protein J4F30_08570 [Acidobacteria bacterium]|nr:hypothetical protein [Acidobacteriota bacterium]
MRRLALLTAAFLVLFSALPEVLPFEALIAAFGLFTACVAWWVWRRR